MKALWNHIVTNNLIPYIAIGIMGFIIYLLWESNIKKDIALNQAEANQKSILEANAIQANYANTKIDEIEALLQSKFKEGVVHEKLTYTIDNNN